MDFSLPASLEPTIAAVRKVVTEAAIPLEADLLQKGFAAVEPRLDEKRADLKRRGLWLPQLPKEHGGMGLSLIEHALVSEELGKSPVGHYLFNCQAPDAGNAEILLKYGTDEQKQRWLVPMLDGQIRSCFSMTE